MRLGFETTGSARVWSKCSGVEMQYCTLALFQEWIRVKERVGHGPRSKEQAGLMGVLGELNERLS